MQKTSFLWFFARLFVEVKYEIQGNKVMLIDGKERDTLTLSTDGKTSAASTARTRNTP